MDKKWIKSWSVAKSMQTKWWRTHNINKMHSMHRISTLKAVNNIYNICGIYWSQYFCMISYMIILCQLFTESGSAICTFYLSSMCSKGAACPFRHVKGDRTIVCKHWLRGLCKKGDDCEFLHEYDMSKMPECYFYSKFGKLQHIIHIYTLQSVLSLGSNLTTNFVTFDIIV